MLLGQILQRAAGKIVKNDDLASARQEQVNQRRADKSGAPCHHNPRSLTKTYRRGHKGNLPLIVGKRRTES